MTGPSVTAIERPDPGLLKLYFLRALLSGPAIFLVLPLLYFRYVSLRYRIDEDGVSMKWGILFRREIDLAYDRIQDLHLSAGFIERWMGLGSVAVQTASGNAGAEMTLEGLRDPEAVRDFLYARMRGAQAPVASAPAAGAAAGNPAEAAEAARLLQQMADDLRAVRESLQSGGPQ